MADSGKSSLRLAVIGAGPIGIEFALQAVGRSFDVEVFERAPSFAGNMTSWEFVKLFSPWSLNMTETGRNVLKELGKPIPDETVFPKGGELRDAYLLPLMDALKSNPHCKAVHYGAEVLSIGRGALLKSESIGGGATKMPTGKPLVKHQRSQTPFTLLVCQGEEERYVEGFDYVIDCSGSYGADHANFVGTGGVPALGERSLRAKKRIWSTIPNVLGSDAGKFAKKRTLVVGAGMSAATTLRDLNQLAEKENGTSILYLTRSGTVPFTVIEDDVLPQRKALCELGNKVANGEVKDINYIGGAAVKAIKETSSGRLSVTIQCADAAEHRVEEVDELVGCCGYRPNSSLYEELQVHQCYASNGPMKLAATLLGASGDCLQQVSAGVDTLKNPEPGFFILGMKSYGRNSAFLLKIGHEQVRCVLEAITPPGAASL